MVDVIGSLEKHVERQQSENTEATASAAPVKEEELNVEESSSGGDDAVHHTNDVTGVDGSVNSVLAVPVAITSIPTSEVVGGKKRSREASSSVERRDPRNARLQTRSKKRVKHVHFKLHETSEVQVAGTTAETPAVRRSLRSAMAKAREGTFEGTSTRAGSEVHVEEIDGDVMPIHDEDGPPLDDRDDDRDEDGNNSIAAERSQHGHSAIKSFDERFKALMGFKEMVGHCNVPRMKSGEYRSLGIWCNDLRTSYKNIQRREKPNNTLTQENIRQLEDAGFKWNLSTHRTFDERYAELLKHKEKVGHCNVQRTKSGGYQSLGKWCNRLRVSYKKIQKNETPDYKLTEENIRKLEDAGFKWSLRT